MAERPSIAHGPARAGAAGITGQRGVGARSGRAREGVGAIDASIGREALGANRAEPAARADGVPERADPGSWQPRRPVYPEWMHGDEPATSDEPDTPDAPDESAAGDRSAPDLDEPGRAALKDRLWGVGVSDDLAEMWIVRWEAEAARRGLSRDERYWELAGDWIDIERGAS
jgi:hypothetical protein